MSVFHLPFPRKIIKYKCQLLSQKWLRNPLKCLGKNKHSTHLWFYKNWGNSYLLIKIMQPIQESSANRWDQCVCVCVCVCVFLTPAEWTMHLGAPVVPDEYMMNRGWLNGSCSNSSWGNWSPSPRPDAKKSSINTLEKKNQTKLSQRLLNYMVKRVHLICFSSTVFHT